MKLLHVDSSILGAGSVSRQLSAEIVAAERRHHAALEVVYRDLAAIPVGHLSGAHLASASGAVPETTDLQQDVAAGQAALAEFLSADIVVVGAPMVLNGLFVRDEHSRALAPLRRFLPAGRLRRRSRASMRAMGSTKRQKLFQPKLVAALREKCNALEARWSCRKLEVITRRP